ncbi:hypothetical protein HPP92_022697 [Vanilla planifolia]|uniref:Uncharacterized protein n=1 Tax=Vanilla planifolia TaxID=51239 RepID=A0A835UDV8_VANPL|nr:hypothetical protein HPP92_022697 [Vanilla planifolia]
MEKYGMVPNHRFFDVMTSNLLAIISEMFYNKVEVGSIVLKNSHAFEFCEKGVIIEGEASSIVAYVIIFGTDGNKMDIGCNPRRKNGILADWFLPYGLIDYVGLLEK